MLDHEQLDVYQVALEFLVFASERLVRIVSMLIKPAQAARREVRMRSHSHAQPIATTAA